MSDFFGLINSQAKIAAASKDGGMSSAMTSMYLIDNARTEAFNSCLRARGWTPVK